MPLTASDLSNSDLPKRYFALDSLRFLGALIIVVAHFAIFADATAVANVVGGVYPLVDYFFILSGFVMMSAYRSGMRSNSDYLAFLKNRLARIYPLHLLLLAAYLGIGVFQWTGLARAADPSKYDPAAIIPNILLLHAWGTTNALSFNFPSWSISAEWMAYLLFPLAIWIARRGGWGAVMGAAAVIFCGLEWLQISNVVRDWSGATFDFGAGRAVLGFFLGVGLFEFVAKHRPKLSSFVPALALFAVGVVLMLLRVDARYSIIFAIIVIGVFAAGELGGAKGFLHHPLLLKLGDASYSIYMIHPLVGTVFVTMIGKKALGLSGTPLLAWAMIVAVPLTLGAAPLIYDRFERPARRFIANWKRRSATETETHFPATATAGG